MREKTNAVGQRAADAERGCDRAEELMAYLYDEAQPSESRAFRAHLETCAVCRAELEAFGDVRRSVALWRAEAEVNAPASVTVGVFEAQAAEAQAAAAPVPFTHAVHARSRSAAAALREFFRLSPLWLRAGTVAAALSICALAALAFARSEVTWDERGLAFRTGVSAREAAPIRVEPVKVEPIAVPAAVEPVGYTAEQVERIVAERVADELAAERARAMREDRRTVITTASDANRRQASRVVAASDKSNAERRAAATGGNTRRRSAAVVDEESLPRLSDLLGTAYD